MREKNTTEEQAGKDAHAVLHLHAAVDELKTAIFHALRIPQIVQWLANILKRCA
jgi:hypothetical protein